MAWYDTVGSVLFGDSMNPNRGKFEDRNYLIGQMKAGVGAVQNRQAPQAGPASTVDTGRADQFRGREMQLADQLGQVASGQQRGAAELAARRAGRDALGNVLGAATMGRGASAAGAARAAARGAAQVGLGTSGQAAQAALGDQSAARQQLASVLGQGRQQDLATAGQNAQAQNQVMLANLQARLQAMGMNDEAIARYLNGISGINQAEAAARAGNNGLLPSLLQSGAQVGAAAMTGGAASDRRVKADIQPADDAIDEMLRGLKPYSWRYDFEQYDGGGVHPAVSRRDGELSSGVMAQDLLQTELGKRVVRGGSGWGGPTDDGSLLVIDEGAAVSMLMAAVARLGQRVDEQAAEIKALRGAKEE